MREDDGRKLDHQTLEALRAKPVPGRARKLSDEQLGELAGLIAATDPLDHGFAVALWIWRSSGS